MNDAAEIRSHKTRHRPGASRGGRPAYDPNIALVRRAVFANDPEFNAFGEGSSHYLSSGTVDFLFAGENDELDIKATFEKLRWGGQLVYVASDAQAVSNLAGRLVTAGFVIDTPPASIWHGAQIFGWGIPGFGRRIHYVTARKVLMVHPGEYSDRFTYDVRLEPGVVDDQRYVVVKRVPTYDSLVERLTQKFPDQPAKIISDRARKMTQTIFPVFLTREVAFLKILQRDLPEADKAKVPRVIAMEKDGRGMVQKVTLNWLRKTHEPISQLEFAIQSARLLQHLHERAHIIHLDLRLDNIVISKHGVGFVDYGSAVRIDENIASSALLKQLFTEIMRTSQIQRMLEKMSNDGSVTSQVLTQSSRRADPAIDLFYLAVQIDRPHSNPYMAELVKFEPQSLEAKLISALVEQVLRPANALDPKYRTAGDVLKGLLAIRKKLESEGELSDLDTPAQTSGSSI